eukprot:TRINITY_DN32874_c0_g1_i1.p1 TRINITY_DN32874_c0_g1~~TRINITY_DN32874_c0_g1_i1.p1  ORF type:complete len:959 (+),score=163.07 TRINITY_DN32874_c0_g1_i1:79-2877(+)
MADVPADVTPADEPVVESTDKVPITLKKKKSLTTLKKQGAFLPSIKKGAATRKQMIEYISLLQWSKTCCVAFPMTLLLWFSLVASVTLQANTDVSFSLRQTLVDDLNNLVATSTRGVAPAQVFSEATDGGSLCVCACAPSAGVLCQGGNASTPTVSKGSVPIVRFSGTVMPAELMELRSRASQFEAMQSEKAQMKRLGWGKFTSFEDVWFWVQHGLIPEVWHEEGNDEPFQVRHLFDGGDAAATLHKTGLLRHRTQIIAGLRMRQRRFESVDCLGDARISEKFSPYGCHGGDLLVSPFGPGTTSYVEGFMPGARDTSAFDVFLDIDRPLHVALETVQYMLQQNDWLDSATDSITIHAMLLNPDTDPPLVGLLQIRFDFAPSGGIESKIDVWSSSLVAYPSLSHVLTDFVWTCLIVCIVLRQLVQVCSIVGVKSSDTALLSFWNLLDWMTIIISVVIAIIWLVLVQKTADIAKSIAALPVAPAFGATPEVVQRYHAIWGVALDDVESLISLQVVRRMALFWYTFVLTLQFFRVFRGQPKLAQLSFVLMSAAEDLLHFLVLFLVFLLNFAFSGFMIYGLELEDWCTPLRAVTTSLKTLMGDTDLERMYEVAPVSTVAWFVLFLACLTFTILNLLLAMIFDRYTLVKASAGAVTGLVQQTKLFLRDTRKRCKCRDFFEFLCSPCFKFGCCRRREDMRSSDEMLEELMFQCEFGQKDRRLVRGSVLGPKFQRKLAETKMFTGEAMAATAANEPSGPDLLKMNLDQDYVDVLVEEALKYSQAEADPNDLKTAQLRELVARAEADIAAMQERILVCQERCKFSLAGMMKQLQQVEVLVHNSLAELVLVAYSAGVADKVERKKKTGVDAKSLNDAVVARTAEQRVLRHLGSLALGSQNSGAGGASPQTTQRPKTRVEEWHIAMNRVKNFSKAKQMDLSS